MPIILFEEPEKQIITAPPGLFRDFILDALVSPKRSYVVLPQEPTEDMLIPVAEIFAGSMNAAKTIYHLFLRNAPQIGPNADLE